MFAVLANRTYRHLFGAQLIALVGTGLATVALGLLAYDIAGGKAGAVLGTALAIKMLAYIGVAPIAGAFADRVLRKALLVALDLVRAGVAVCLPFVERAIALVNPSLLLLAGGASAKAMLKQDQGILSLRGRWFEWRSSDGALEAPAMPSLHPAFLLRQPAAKKNAWSDLMTLAERLDRPSRDP